MMIKIIDCFKKGLRSVKDYNLGSFKMLNMDNKIYQMADWTERQELYFFQAPECGGPATPASVNNGVWNYF